MNTFTHRWLVMGLLALTPLLAQSAETGDAAAFKAAYAGFKEAQSAGDHERALPYAERAFKLGLALYGESDKNVPALATNHGKTLLKLGRTAEARKVLSDALRRYETVYGSQALELVDPLMELGHASAVVGDSRRQEEFYSRALRIARRHGGDNADLRARLSMEAGLQIMQRSGTTGGAQYLRDAHIIYKTSVGPNHLNTGLAAYYLGQHEMMSGRPADAAEHLRAALEVLSAQDPKPTKMMLSTHGMLVQAYEQLGRRGDATEHCLAVGRLVHSGGGTEVFPLYQVSPAYPAKAFEKNLMGEVVVESSVDASGFVRDPVVVSTVGDPGFEAAALEAVKQFRYAPRFVDGEPVATAGVRNTLTFAFE